MSDFAEMRQRAEQLTVEDCRPGVVVSWRYRASEWSASVIGFAPVTTANPKNPRVIVKEETGRVSTHFLKRLRLVRCGFCLDPDCWNGVYRCEQAQAVVAEESV